MDGQPWLTKAKEMIGGAFSSMLEDFENIEISHVSQLKYETLRNDIHQRVDEILSQIAKIRTQDETDVQVMRRLEQLSTLQSDVLYFKKRVFLLLNTLPEWESALMHSNIPLLFVSKSISQSKQGRAMWDFFEDQMTRPNQALEYQRLWSIYRIMVRVPYNVRHTQKVYDALTRIYQMLSHNTEYEDVYEMEYMWDRGVRVGEHFPVYSKALDLATATLTWYDQLYQNA